MDDLYFLGDRIEKIIKALEQTGNDTERVKLLSELRQAQNECPHWERWKTPDPKNPEKLHCSFCRKDWDKVAAEGPATTITTP